MKRLLVIANLHHASPRIPALLHYLSDLGWNSTVITPELGDEPQSVLGFPNEFLDKVEIIVSPYRGDIFWPLRKLLNIFGFSKESSYTEQLKEEVIGGRSWIDYAMLAYQTFLAFPDTEWPWHHSAFKTASKAIDENSYDLILSSSPFPTVHRVASKLKRKYQIPWVADFRDPWSQSHNYTLPKLRHKLDRWLELKTLSNANRIITVSLGFAEKLKSLHNIQVDVIRNGFQPVSKRPEVEFPKKFTIGYTGTIYSGKQDPSKIILALKRLLDKGEIVAEHIILEFYGRYDSDLQNIIDKHDLSNVVVQKGSIPRAEIRKYQMSVHLLLLLQWEATEERGIFPLKFYEYLDSRRPILVTGGDAKSELADLLDETKTGYLAIDVDEIMAVLKKAYAEFTSTGMIKYSGDVSCVTKYSYLSAAEKLNKTLESILDS